MTRARTALVAATVAVSTLAGCTSDPSEPGSRAPAGSPRHTAPATAHVRPSRVSAPLPTPTVTARVLRWRLPSPRSRAVAVRYGARVLLAGGLGPGDRSTDEVLGLDLSYAPPFAPVWDPVLIAARKAFEAVEADVRADVRAGL